MRVTLVTNTIPPYRESLYHHLNVRLGGSLRVVVTLPTASSVPRSYAVVPCTACFNLWRHRAHPLGYEERARTPIPWGLARCLRDSDVIIVHGLGTSALVAAMHAANVGAPLVLWATLSEDTEQGRGSISTAVRRHLIRRASAIIVNGASGRRYIERLVPGRRVHTLVVPYTIDMDPYLSIPVERAAVERTRLLTVGQLIPRKGLFQFAELVSQWLSEVPTRSVRWSIIGDGPLQDSLTRCSFSPRFTIDVGKAVRYEQLPSVYASHGVFAFPTLADEWGVVVNEAMASGLPILGSVRSQAVQELVISGESGQTFDPLGPLSDGLDALTCLLECENLGQMGHRARAAAVQCTPPNAADRIVELLETLG